MRIRRATALIATLCALTCWAAARWPISDPRNPTKIANTRPYAGTSTEDMQVISIRGRDILSVGLQECGAHGTGTVGLELSDITDPHNPESLRGSFQANYAHSARANANGTIAYVSYWDAGFVMLDIRDPANPRFLGRTSYALDDEGNAHSVDEARGGNLLLGADEDNSPFALTFTSSAFSGSRPSAEAEFTPSIFDQPNGEMSGEVVYVGRGCPADPRPVPPVPGSSSTTPTSPTPRARSRSSTAESAGSTTRSRVPSGPGPSA